MRKSPGRRGFAKEEEGAPGEEEDSVTHTGKAPQPPSLEDSLDAQEKSLSSVQLSDSLDEESAVFEAKGAQFNSPEEEALGDGLGALEPDLDELWATGASQKPAVDDDNRTRVEVLAKLAIVEGPDAKKDVPFIGIRMCLGRAPNLEISLSDIAVSRRHAEFIRGNDGVLLRDLGSGNGTLVNGLPVTEQILTHNDLITVGATKLRYINEIEARAKPEPTIIQPMPAQLAPHQPKELDATDEQEKAVVRKRPPLSSERRDGKTSSSQIEKLGETPRKKKPLLLVSTAGILLCLLMVFWGRGKEPLEEEPVNPRAHAEDYMRQAREAVRQENYDEALAFLEQAKAINANIDVFQLGPQIELEREAKKGLQEAEELVERKEFDQAQRTLDKTPDASARLNEEKKRIAQLIVTRRQQSFLEHAEELLMLGDFDAATNAMRLLPVRQQATIGERIAEGQAAYDEAKRREQMSRANAAKAEAQARAEARKRQLKEAFAEVQRKFNAEEWRRAADECDRVMADHPGDAEIRKRAQELKRQIPEFGNVYDEGVKKYRAGQIAASAVPLKRAHTLYLRMGFASAIDDSLKEMLSQASFFAGEGSLSRGDYAAAATHFLEALKLQPTGRNAENARNGLLRVAAKAGDLFSTGYNLRSSNPKEARRYFDLIIAITLPGSEWHNAAKNQINTLSSR